MTADSRQFPLVSVIMNCLNCRRYLREALDSVLAQTYPHWEIIFWDNASVDDSAALAQSCDERLRYFRGKETIPLGMARNRALEQVQGDYVALLDCDDVWLPHKLEVQVQQAETSPKLGMVFSDCFYIDSEGRTLGTFFSKYKPPQDGKVLSSLLTGRNFIACPTALMRTAAVRQVGGFNPVLSYSEEYDLFLRLALDYQVTFIPEPLAKFRLHTANLTGTGSPGTTRETIKIIRDVTSKMAHLTWRDRLKIQKRLWELRAKLMLQSLRK